MLLGMSVKSVFTLAVILHDISRSIWRQCCLFVMSWEIRQPHCNTLCARDGGRRCIWPVNQLVQASCKTKHCNGRFVHTMAVIWLLAILYYFYVCGGYSRNCLRSAKLHNHSNLGWVNFSSCGPPAGVRPELQPKQINNPWAICSVEYWEKPVIKKSWVTP